MSGEGGELETEGFVNAAADAVATDGGFEDLLGDDDAEALVVLGVGRKNETHQRGADGLAVLVGVADAAARMKAVFLGNHSVILALLGAVGAKKGGCGAASEVLDGEAGAAFDAATLQDLAAGLGGVALHEAVFDLALAFVGLVSAFRHDDSLFSG